jgi:hypothetical protein
MENERFGLVFRDNRVYKFGHRHTVNVMQNHATYHFTPPPPARIVRRNMVRVNTA